MKLTTNAFVDGAAIDPRYSFCKIADGDTAGLDQHQPEDALVVFADNFNPDLSWSQVPENTKSFALTFVDETCPTKPDDVNQKGREVPEDLPRADFFHWLLVDIHPEQRQIDSGDFSDVVSRRGKSNCVAFGRVGLNDYTGWFKGDEDMEGQYFGYDGPCPPWNDSLIHTYHLTLYALDITKCDLAENFEGKDLLAAIEGHVLESASLSCTYTLNPRLKK